LITQKIDLDMMTLQDLFGIEDSNLRELEKELKVSVVTREGCAEIIGETEDSVDTAAEVLRTLDKMRRVGEPMNAFAVTRALHFVRSGDPDGAVAAMKDVIAYTYNGAPIKCRTIGQRRYVKAMQESTVTIAIGPAGTGKTYLAVAAAVAALKNKKISKIVMCRPAVEAGEKLGFLPGDLQTKVDPYLRPLYDALDELLGPETVARYMETRVIEIAPLAYMRGRTLKDCCLIADECQNMSLSQHLMILTRLGEGSQMVLTGDVTQIDLPSAEDSGLDACANILDGMEGISVIRLGGADVVRHKLVGEIVKAFEKHTKAAEKKNVPPKPDSKKYYKKR